MFIVTKIFSKIGVYTKYAAFAHTVTMQPPLRRVQNRGRTMSAPHGSPEGGSSALPCYDAAHDEGPENRPGKLTRLPEDRQAYAAGDDEMFRIPDDRLPGVPEGLAQAERGEFASDEEMDALWKKCGL